MDVHVLAAANSEKIAEALVNAPEALVSVLDFLTFFDPVELGEDTTQASTRRQASGIIVWLRAFADAIEGDGQYDA